MAGDGHVNPRAAVLGVATIVLVVAARRLLAALRLPKVDLLLALLAAAAVAAQLGWTTARADGSTLVAVVGNVPAGLPAFHVPAIQLAWLRELGGSAGAIAVLGLLEAIAISKSIANSTGQRLDYNRQCLAEGLANLGGGFFQCLPGSGSLTRSAINHQAGAVSRASGLFAAATVAVVVALLAPLARFVPKAALAGLLMVTAVRLVDWRRLAYALRASRFDAALVVVTAFTAIFLSVEYSILVGVVLSIVLFVPRAAKLQARELTVAADRVIRGRQTGDPQCRPIVIYDLEGELFFGAALQLERHFDELRQRTRAGAKVVILRLRRTRNPDSRVPRAPRAVHPRARRPRHRRALERRRRRRQPHDGQLTLPPLAAARTRLSARGRGARLVDDRRRPPRLSTVAGRHRSLRALRRHSPRRARHLLHDLTSTANGQATHQSRLQRRNGRSDASSTFSQPSRS